MSDSDDGVEKLWIIIRLILIGIGGCLYLIYNLSTETTTFWTGAFLSLGGFPTAWSITEPSSRQQWIDFAQDCKTGQDDSLFRFFTRLIGSIILGAIIAPFWAIFGIIKLFR